MKLKLGLLIILASSIQFLVSNQVFGQSVADITAKFCNSGTLTENLNFSTNSAKINEICVQFTNNSDKDMLIKIGFPDGAITNDDFKRQACKGEGNIQNFGQYVTQSNKTLIIPAKKTITQKNQIKFPAGFAGIVHGCMTYFLDQTNQNSDQNNLINIIVRQTNFIDILVGSNFKREIFLKNFLRTNNGGSNKKINTEFNFDSIIFVKLNFVNNGDVDELFTGSGKIYNNIGFLKDFEIPQTKLLANSTKEISINIGSLPFYGGFFKIKINGETIPEISFNKDSLDPKLKDPIQIEEKTTIRIIPRNIIIPLIIFLIIFFLVRYFKKTKTTGIHKLLSILPFKQHK